MCKKCNKSSCGGCGGGSSSQSNEVAQLQNQISDLQDTVNTLLDNAAFLLKGHPILLVQNVDDVNSFDLSSGLGIAAWDGWALCDGQQQASKTNPGTFLTTPNFTDRFIVHAGGSYMVNDVGGADSITLTVPQMPAHNHAVVDPGHSHDITDPGHLHAVNDPGHTHGGSSAPHIHHFTTDAAGAHNHSYDRFDPGGSNYNLATTTPPYQATLGNVSATTNIDGVHQHGGNTDPASTVVTIATSFTGVQTQNAFIGITQTEVATTSITTSNNGGDQPHENRPPYYAAFYVIKL